ncbi:MAG: HipA domain-containing protein [Butyrivibrio sp.]|nr:HipA domain-containing protein [Butyrivibrio sp.]
MIGNTDCHVKNFSLLYSSDLKSKRLAPAYDLVATRVYKTTSDMSFYIGGELDIERITRESFSLAADEIGMTTRVVLNIFDDVADRLESAMDQAANELANQGFESADSLKKEILMTRGSSGIR